MLLKQVVVSCSQTLFYAVAKFRGEYIFFSNVGFSTAKFTCSLQPYKAYGFIIFVKVIANRHKEAQNRWAFGVTQWKMPTTGEKKMSCLIHDLFVRLNRWFFFFILILAHNFADALVQFNNISLEVLRHSRAASIDMQQQRVRGNWAAPFQTTQNWDKTQPHQKQWYHRCERRQQNSKRSPQFLIVTFSNVHS